MANLTLQEAFRRALGATKDYVDNAVENVSVDLTGYATEDYVDNAVENVTPATITEEDINAIIADIDN